MDEPTPSLDSIGRSRVRRSTQDRAATDITTPPAVPSSTVASGSAAGTGQQGSGEHATGAPSNGASTAEGGFVGRLRERAGAHITTQKDRATDGLGTIAQAVRRSTQELRGDRHDTLAEYVEQAADQLERLSTHLKNKDVSELFHDAQRLARRRPVAFIGSAFAVGLLGARFLKSSRARNARTQPVWQRGAHDRPSGTSAPDYSTAATLREHHADPERV